MEEHKADIVEVDGMELHLDPEPDDNGALHTALPPRLESWRRRSATGAILTGIGLGLKQVLEPQRDEPSIIVQSSGDPPSDLPVEAELGGFHPSGNVVRIRPWLLEKAEAGPGALDSSEPWTDHGAMDKAPPGADPGAAGKAP